SVGQAASAIAIPGAGPAAAAPAKLAAATTSTNVGSDVPLAETAGSTGNATSVSISGDGPASSVAISGDSGSGAAGSATGQALALGNLPVNRALLGLATSSLTSSLVNDIGPAAATLGSVPCPMLF